MTNRNRLVITCATLLLMLATMLNGCSMVDQRIVLNYAPVEKTFSRQNASIAVTRTDPKQPVKEGSDWIIGALNNVYGVRQADLLTNRSTADWITDALLFELKRIGYNAHPAKAIQPEVRYTIHLSEINAFMHITRGNVTCESKQELKFNVDLYLNGVKTKTLSVLSQDNQTLPLKISKEKKEKIMSASLQDAMLQLLPEITAFTARQ